MGGGLVANFAAISTVASHVDAAATHLHETVEIRDASWTGSGAVVGAVVESSRLRAARVRVVGDALMLRAGGVRDAVTAMVDADTVAAASVSTL